MPNCTFHIVDAFTAVPFTGNPCAVVTDADGIEPADMLRIARETNAPETAFVLASDKADVRVRYFMPRGKSSCGHPTMPRGTFAGTGRAQAGHRAVRVRHRRAARGHPPRQGDHDPAPRRPGHVRRRRDNGPRRARLPILREGLPCQLMRGASASLMVPVRELAAPLADQHGQAPPA